MLTFNTQAMQVIPANNMNALVFTSKTGEWLASTIPALTGWTTSAIADKVRSLPQEWVDAGVVVSLGGLVIGYYA